MKDDARIYLGVKGRVMALNRTSGGIIWETPLKSGGFVQVVLDGEDIFATTLGEIFCLDRTSGTLRWNNPLKGCGLGLVSIAIRDGSSDANRMLIAAEEQIPKE